MLNELRRVMNKKPFTRPQPLSSEAAFEQNEAQFWKEVAEKSESMIANLIEKVLPISAIPSVFKLEKDADYCHLLEEDLPNFYQDNEEYQEKISQGNWTEADVEYASQDLTCQYFEMVVGSLVSQLSEYDGFDTTSLTNLRGI
jgi:hypothetical protein